MRGRPASTTTRSPAAKTTARGAHPGQSVAACALGLLAEPRRHGHPDRHQHRGRGDLRVLKATGTLKKGSGLSGHDIGTVTVAAFGSCVALGSVPLTATSRGLPWRISFTSYNAKTEVVRGTVSGVSVALTGSCQAVVNGSSGPVADGVISAVCNDRIGQLTFLSSGSNLHYWHVRNCEGLTNDGDPVALTASCMIRPIQDITSP
jgi:hypothetical protein